jgi:hypothetical protein
VNKHFTLTLLSLFMIACTPEYVKSEEELQSYVLDEDNDLIKMKQSKGYDIQLAYRPVDLLILQETGGNTSVEPDELRKLLNKYKNQYYFILSFSKDNKEALYKMDAGFDHFSDLVQKLSFGMNEHVNLTTSGRDTIYVADYVFPRTYGMGSSTSLLFAFEREKAKDDEWIQFNLSEFGMGLGRQTFRFNKKDINNAPGINYVIKGEHE